MSDITVVFGGPSPEHDISILTGLQAERILRRHGDVNAVYWDRRGNWHLVPAETEARDYIDGPPAKATELELSVGGSGGWSTKKGLRTRHIDAGVVLNCCHGGLGEGGGAQGLFTLAGIPSTGASVWAAALGMDKYAFGTAVRAAGLPTLPRELLTETSTHTIDGPLIAKPRFGGSSIGIEVADSVDTARALLRNSIHLRLGAVVEPFREDLYDLNISYRTHPQFEVSLIERPLKGGGGSIYSFADKYLNQAGLAGAPRELPAQVSDAVRDAIYDCARAVRDVTGITGIVRVDFLSDGTEVFVNEVNSIPGAMALYLWPDHAADRLLLDALDEARKEFTAAAAAQAGNPTAALQVAGGISGKLTGLRTEG
ncbi:hypothetical protein LV457_08045 [Mycobacterium sp. MYCO198283]|uniref:hypothetical protein n=1 Tax=Mycobacterium sp. MYCO198283 TaxID=2883505 RepID=UPI001E61EFE2|nr:hypothetical protein [Mycobacterium sp. MYCO198283]MCG5432243.1 hypothetical protein [Mycobacterium sp. MYCO198283]